MRHLMIDIETLALTPRAHVLSIGAVVFDPADSDPRREPPGDRFYAVLTDVGQETRERDPATVRWWLRQACEGSQAAREFLDSESSGNSYHARDAISYLAGLVQHRGIERVWGNGPQFDLVALETLAADLELRCPWTHRQPRDLRTLREAAWPDGGHDTDPSYPKFEGVEHHALADALHQAAVVCAAMRRFQHLRTRAVAAGGWFEHQ